MNPNDKYRPIRRGVAFTLCEEDYHNLRQSAIKAGVNASEYIRSRLGFKTLKQMQIDEWLTIAARKRNEKKHD